MGGRRASRRRLPVAWRDRSLKQTCCCVCGVGGKRRGAAGESVRDTSTAQGTGTTNEVILLASTNKVAS